MSVSGRIGIALLIILILWFVAYWRLFAPVKQQADKLQGLELTKYDTVGTNPENEPTDSEPSIVDETTIDEPVVTPDPVDQTDTPPIELPPPPVTFPYTVQQGDTMETIAQHWFGRTSKWVLIAQENPFVDPMKLRVGQGLRLPSKETTTENVDPKWLESILKETRYVVSQNDTLSSIANHFYGKSQLWSVIYEANRDVLANPDDLRLGMELVIPPQHIPAE